MAMSLAVEAVLHGLEVAVADRKSLGRDLLKYAKDLRAATDAVSGTEVPVEVDDI